VSSPSAAKLAGFARSLPRIGHIPRHVDSSRADPPKDPATLGLFSFPGFSSVSPWKKPEPSVKTGKIGGYDLSDLSFRCTMYAGVCMALLQVRDCPDDIYQKISRVARREKRTIAQQIIVMLENSLGQETSNRERRLKVLDRISSREVSKEAQDIDAVALIREDRDR